MSNVTKTARTGRKLAAILVVSVCAAVFADVQTNTYYTVTVDSGTYSSPVSLEDLTVTVEKEGEATATKSLQ